MSNTITLDGRVLGINPTRSYTGQNGQTYYERKLWLDLTDNPQYPNACELTAKQADLCTSLDNLKKGDDVRAIFRIKGRKYPKKDAEGQLTGQEGFIQELVIWKIDKLTITPAAMAGTPAAAQPAAGTPSPLPAAIAEGGDDLPF